MGVLLFIVLGLLLSKRCITEMFASKEIVKTTNFANQAIWVMRAGKGDWVVNDSVETEIFNASPGKLVVAYASDPMDGDVLSQEKGYFVSVSTRQLAFRIDCGFNLGGLKVGYFDRVESQFIEALISGYRMERSEVTLVPLQANDAMKLGRHLQDGTIDLAIVYVIPKSPFHRIIQSQSVSIMGFSRLDIDRVKVFMPEAGLEAIKLKDIFFDVGGAAASVMAREDDTKLPFIYSRVIRIKQPEKQKSILDTFITSMEVDNRTYDPTYKCYGDPSTDIRALCESSYDVNGLPKKKETVWDQPCKENTDCPFYDKSQERGGCNKFDGMCELPVAVKRLGYRQHDASGVYEPFKRGGKYIFATK